MIKLFSLSVSFFLGNKFLASFSSSFCSKLCWKEGSLSNWTWLSFSNGEKADSVTYNDFELDWNISPALYCSISRNAH